MRAISTLPVPVQGAVILVKQHSSGYQAALAGPIMPKWLPAAMPPYGKRSSKMDKVALLLLTEVIAAYLPKGGEVFFRGFAYQINRSDLASRWDCKQSDITRALTFLVKAGLVQRTHRPHKGADGEYAGKAAFVIPVIEKVLERINQVKCRSEALGTSFSGTLTATTSAPTSSLNGTPPDAHEHVSPNSAESAVNADEHNGGAAHEVTGGPASASPSSKSRSGWDDPTLCSSAFAAPEARLTQSKTAAEFSGYTAGATGQEPTSPVKTSQASSPQERADQYIALWVEAVQRSGLFSLYTPSDSDRRAVLKFFTENHNHKMGRLLFFAIRAWNVTESKPQSHHSDPFFYCHKAFGISDFFHHFTQIQRELLSAGLTFTSQSLYQTLRWYYLDQELMAMGFRDCVLNNMGRELQTNYFWENTDPVHFKEYYISRNRPVPSIGLVGQPVPVPASTASPGSNGGHAAPTPAPQPGNHVPPDSPPPPMKPSAPKLTQETQSATASIPDPASKAADEQDHPHSSAASEEESDDKPISGQCSEERPARPLGSALRRLMAGNPTQTLTEEVEPEGPGTRPDQVVTGNLRAGRAGATALATTGTENGEPPHAKNLPVEPLPHPTLTPGLTATGPTSDLIYTPEFKKTMRQTFEQLDAKRR